MLIPVSLMSNGLDPERERQLVEAAAKFVIKHGLEVPTQIFVETTSPFGEMIGGLGFLFGFLPITTLFGRSGVDVMNMMGFDYKANTEKILERVRELKKEEELREKSLPEKKFNAGKRGRFLFLNRFKGKIT
jgi:hypothetical protein